MNAARSRAHLLAGLAVLVVLTCVPNIAQACPTCAQSDGGAGNFLYVILGVMIVLPFVIVGIVMKVLKIANSES